MTVQPVRKKMNRIKAWFKKHTFYMVLVIIVIVLLLGYIAWLRQPLPLVHENAENARIGTSSINGSEPGKYLALHSVENDFRKYYAKTYILSDEGEAKLIEELKKYTVRQYYQASNETYGWEEIIAFPVDYELNGFTYDKYIYFGKNRTTMSNNIFPTNGEGRPPLKPDSYYETCIPSEKDRASVFDAIMQIIEEYGTEVETPEPSGQSPIEIEINGGE